MIDFSTKEFPAFLGSSANDLNRAAVILAGGEGSRLRSLTQRITGDDRPKQFCPIVGGETLLDITRSRVAMSVSRENTYFSLTQKHERYFQRQLAGVGKNQMVVQPEARGTAPAIIYSLLRVAKDMSDPTIAFFPSDHYFSNDEKFIAAVDAAYRAAEREPETVVLLGIEADKAETSYGWIQPHDSFFSGVPGSVNRVDRFWEKPDSRTAQKLRAEGCLWNSFVMVGKTSAFLKMVEEALPLMYRMFSAGASELGKVSEGAVIRSVYSWINETNFSTEVLERSSEMLRVLRVGDVGWSDLGEPERVLGAIKQLGITPRWLQPVAA
ncbi:MAG: hypothetical protein HOP17_15920 [Acidobacteria bacterium]|nr:hypothetical protein [Acidobacteriota bacterium]